MRTRRLIGLTVLVLILSVPTAAFGQSTPATNGADPEPQSTNSQQAPARPLSSDIDLGTATLGSLEAGLGPFAFQLGLFDRLMIGTYTLPWMAAAIVPTVTAGNVSGAMPNVSAKAELFRGDTLRASLSGSLFYLRVGDIDDNSFEIGAVIVPVVARVAADWDHRNSTVLELGTVRSALGGELSIGEFAKFDAGLTVRSTHAGITQRLRITEGFSVWARARTLLGPAVLRASFSGALTDLVDVDTDARASTGSLTSGFTGSAGVHFGKTRYGLTIGAGHGTWFVPGLYFPIGRNLPFVEFNLYFRF